MGFDRHDVLPGRIQARADQVVHGAVDDGEVLVFGGLEEQHLGDKDAGVSGNGPARFDVHRQVAGDVLEQGLHVIDRRRWRFLVVGDAQATAQIQMVNFDTQVL